MFVYKSEFSHVLLLITILIYLLLNAMRLLNLFLIYDTRCPLEVEKRSGPTFSPTRLKYRKITYFLCNIGSSPISTVNLAQNDPMQIWLRIFFYLKL